MATAGSGGAPAAQQPAKPTESRGRKTSVLFNARASAAGAGLRRKSEGSGKITNAVAIKRDEVVTVHRQLKDNLTGVKTMVEALKKEKDEAEVRKHQPVRKVASVKQPEASALLGDTDENTILKSLDLCLEQLDVLLSSGNDTVVAQVRKGSYSAIAKLTEAIGESKELKWVAEQQKLYENEPLERVENGILWNPLLLAKGASNIVRFGMTVDDSKETQLEMFLHLHLNSWLSFDAFEFAESTGNYPLVRICWTLCESMNLFKQCKIPEQKAFNFFIAVEQSYDSKNSYHNSTHAADVVQAISCLLRAEKLKGVFSHLDVFTLLLAGAVHDVDHKGFTNGFLVKSNHDLAILYYGESTMENHHLSVVYKLLKEEKTNLLSELPSQNERAWVWKTTMKLVLATDINRHKENLAASITLMETSNTSTDKVLWLTSHAERVQVMKSILQCADISNPTRASEIAKKWTKAIATEFDNEGIQEKRLKLEVTLMNDPNVRSEPKWQAGFIVAVCLPVWEVLAKLIGSPATEMLEQAEKKYYEWLDILHGEKREERSAESQAVSGETAKMIATEKPTKEETVSPSEKPSAGKKFYTYTYDV